MDLAIHILAVAKAVVELMTEVVKGLTETRRLRRKLKDRRH